jgi:formate hydrogenlyase transcriptional activator
MPQNVLPPLIGEQQDLLEKQILSIGAMFQDDFNVDWLVELTGLKAMPLLTILEDQVKNGGLAATGPGIYTFLDKKLKKGLIEKISAKQKHEWHQKIAALLMDELAMDACPPDLLSHHLLQIPNDLEGCRCLVKTGDVHQKKFNNEIAFRCYEKAIEDLYNLDGKEVDLLFAETAIKFSKLSTARHDTSSVLKILYDAWGRAVAMKNMPFQILLQMHVAKNEWFRANFSKALTQFENGWRQARALKEPKLLRTANTFSTFFLFWQGRFQEVVGNYEQSVSDIDKLPMDQFPLLAAITVGYCYSQIGQTTQGLGMIDTIRTSCLERGDLYLSSYSTGNMGSIMINIRRIDEALKYLNQAAEEAEQAHNEWVWLNMRIMMAFAHYLKGETKKCIQYLRNFMKHRKKAQISVLPYPYLLSLALAMKKGKLPQVEGITLEEEIKVQLRTKNYYHKAHGFRYLSYLYKIEKKPVEKSLRCLHTAGMWAERSGHAMEKAWIKIERARLYLYQGRKDRAVQLAEEGTRVLKRFNENLVPDDLRSLVERSAHHDSIFQTMLKMTPEVAAIRNYKDLVQRIISTVNRLTGAERGAIFQLSPEGPSTKLEMRGSKNLTSAHVEHPNFASSMKLIEEVAKTGKGRIMESSVTQKEPFFSTAMIRSKICVPMIFRNKVVGVLYHDNRLLSSAFKAHHLELLSFFGAIAAIALYNAQANKEIQRLNKILNQEKQYYEEEHIQSLHFKEIVGQSPGIRQVLSQVEHVAKSDATVLITGETGVGKELVARAIHRLSRRKKKPFIRVHCSALPKNLIASELFGHEKGAFTGALKRRIGRFELADSGTLFLDEMGEIDADIQTSLLRVLQTKAFERVGGTETLRSDFRLITATNRNLQNEVKKARFRADLYYRLNVFPIHVPPLRERREDIPLLARHFLKIHSKRTGKQFSGIDKKDMEHLVQYSWSGNVRELENVMERACILSTGDHLRIPKLESEKVDTTSRTGLMTLSEMEATHIRCVLDQTDWKVKGPGGAAELLDVNPSTLRFRMKKHGIERPA